MTQFLGTQQISAGINDNFHAGPDGLKGVLIGNESGLTVVIFMDGTSHSKSLYPGTVDFFPISGGFSGTIKWTTQALLNNVAQWPSSFLQFDAVGINENINVGVYPLTLPRLTNIGNSVPVSTATNAIVNDGNPSATQFVEVTVAGAPGSSFIFKSDGTISIAELIANVVTPFIQSFPGQTVILKLGELGKTTEVLGALQVDQNGAIRATLNTTISLAMGIAADTNRGLVIFGHSATQSGNLLALQTSAFANIFTVGPTGNTTISGILSALSTLSVIGSSSLDNGALATDGSGNINAIGSGTNIAGTVGTLSYSFPIWGNFLKVLIVTMTNFDNNINEVITFPSNMTRGVFFVGGLGGGAGTVQPRLGVANVNTDIISGLGSNVAGTINTQTNIHQASYGIVTSAINDIVVATVAGVQVNSSIVFIGF